MRSWGNLVESRLASLDCEIVFLEPCVWMYGYEIGGIPRALISLIKRTNPMVITMLKIRTAAFRHLFATSCCLLACSLGSLDQVSGQDGPENSAPAIASSDSINQRLSSELKQLSASILESGELTKAESQSLKRTLESQFDSYVTNFEQIMDGQADPTVAKQLETLAETREAFIEARLAIESNSLTGEKTPDMEHQVFLDLCRRLGVMIDLGGKIVQGVPVEDSQVITLLLPNMDCPGCAMVVRDKLGAIEGVHDSLTSHEEGFCLVRVDEELELDKELDELAKSVAQFKEWSKK